MENLIIPIVCTAVATLICKYIWDRYMAKSSRVSVATHEKDIGCLKRHLDNGSQTFKEISICLSTVCMCQLELCEKLKINCSDIKKIMIESGLGL